MVDIWLTAVMQSRISNIISIIRDGCLALSHESRLAVTVLSEGLWIQLLIPFGSIGGINGTINEYNGKGNRIRLISGPLALCLFATILCLSSNYSHLKLWAEYIWNWLYIESNSSLKEINFINFVSVGKSKREESLKYWSIGSLCAQYVLAMCPHSVLSVSSPVLCVCSHCLSLSLLWCRLSLMHRNSRISHSLSSRLMSIGLVCSRRSFSSSVFCWICSLGLHLFFMISIYCWSQSVICANIA